MRLRSKCSKKKSKSRTSPCCFNHNKKRVKSQPFLSAGCKKQAQQVSIPFHFSESFAPVDLAATLFGEDSADEEFYDAVETSMRTTTVEDTPSKSVQFGTQNEDSDDAGCDFDNDDE